MIARADTFFVATASPAAGGSAVEGVDVSHRGGRAGIVKVTEQDGCTILTSPDFAGTSSSILWATSLEIHARDFCLSISKTARYCRLPGKPESSGTDPSWKASLALHDF